MLKLFTKKDAMISDLEYEMNTYEDELQDEGYVEIERFSGYQAKKGFDYDVIIRVYEEEDSEVTNFHYFSYTVESEENAEKLIAELIELIENKSVKVKTTFRG